MAHQLILFALLAISFAHCDIVRVDGGFSANFQITNIGRMYETLTPTIQLDVYACAFECILHLNCLTINHNKQKNLCELVGQNYDEMEADTSDPDWANFGTPAKADGNFSDWQKVGACSVTCENGTQMEQRKCDDPQPRFGGKPCQGQTFRQVKCITDIQCPISGSWSIWTTSGWCSTCVRNRICDAPPPQHHGSSCLRSDNVTRSLDETQKTCKACDISDYVKCGFVKGENIGTSVNTFHGVSSDKECIERCYESKRKYPQIVGIVTKVEDDSGKCWCKKQSAVTKSAGYKMCWFKEINLVRSGSANQYPTDKELLWPASQAVDGDAKTWSSTSSMEVAADSPSWWSVETQSPIVLQKIKITFSQDLFSQELRLYKDFKIEVKSVENEAWALCKWIGTPSSIVFDVKCDESEKIMKFIRIGNTGRLVLHEVEIYGWPTHP